MGAERATKFAEAHGLGARIVYRAGADLREVLSPALAAMGS
jgi:hypothetical protein